MIMCFPDTLSLHSWHIAGGTFRKCECLTRVWSIRKRVVTNWSLLSTFNNIVYFKKCRLKNKIYIVYYGINSLG